MAAAGWVTGADNYFNRVTKAQIIAAVEEAKGEGTAELIADLKKKEMAIEAERLLAGTGWLPECLRTPEPLDASAEASPFGLSRRDRGRACRMSGDARSPAFEEQE